MTLPVTLVRIEDPSLDSWIGGKHELHTSLEGENPGRSIKDRMVEGALARLLEQGALGPGKILTEASAGSTARSLAHYCGLLKIRCVLFVPDTLAQNRQEDLRAHGAEVRPVPLPQGWELFESFCARPEVVAFDQHGDTGKRAHYRGLGQEANRLLGRFEILVGAVGTGHSLLGTAEGMSPRPRVVTAEPATAAVEGIRNVATTRYGKNDGCDPNLFDQRIVLEASEFFEGRTLRTSLGTIRFPDSFRVALGATARLLRSGPVRKVFVLGAANERVKA